MGLQGRTLLISMIALTAAVVGGTVWLWPRLGSGGVLRVLARVGAILACQLCAILVLAVAVNDYFDFYGSWGDLLGTNSRPFTVKEDRNSGLGGFGPGPRAEVHTTVLDVDRQYGTPDPRPGRVVPAQIPGGTTGLRDAAFVYLPPQYDEPAFARTRFPVTLVLAGYPGHIGTLTRNLDTIGVMDGLLRRGRAEPMVMVLMSPTLAPPRDTECADIAGGPQVESYFNRDVPAWLAANYRVKPPGHDWGVLGVSTGGFCAVKFALRHPSVFDAAVGLSGYLHAIADPTTGDLYAGSSATRDENDPLWRMAHLPIPAVSVLLTVGRTERVVYPDVANFLALVKPPMDAASIVVPASGHNFDVWKRLLPTCFQWLSTKFG